MKTEKNIYQKLLIIQKAVKGLSKDKESFSFKYVTGNKLLGFIKPLTKKGDKSEILSKVMMRFTWIDCETGEKDENLFGANGQNDWEKGLGSALTYAERYFIMKYFHIATDEDDVDNPHREKSDPIKTQLTEKGYDYLKSDKATAKELKVALADREMKDEQRDVLNKVLNVKLKK